VFICGILGNIYSKSASHFVVAGTKSRDKWYLVLRLYHMPEFADFHEMRNIRHSIIRLPYFILFKHIVINLLKPDGYVMHQEV
jgi:hypothetical protein